MKKIPKAFLEKGVPLKFSDLKAYSDHIEGHDYDAVCGELKYCADCVCGIEDPDDCCGLRTPLLIADRLVEYKVITKKTALIIALEGD